MRILFAGKQHFETGGIPASTDQLADRLHRHGHEVAVLARSPNPRRGLSRPPAVMRRLGHPGHYEAFAAHRFHAGPALGILAESFRPDVVVVNAGGRWWHDWTRALVMSAPPGVPLVLYVRDAEGLELLDELAPGVDLVLVNAEHHARVAASRGVAAQVVPSVVDADRYRTEPSGEVVVFVNPVATKGVEIAFALAGRRPDVRFEFRQSWTLAPVAATRLRARAARLGNIAVLPSVTDPRALYGRARVLLAPYVDLGRPRVVAEAQASGIPALACDDPGLREAVGPGGILVPRDAPLEAWLDGLGRLWDDGAERQRLADAARLHSRRPEMDPDRITARFVVALEGIVGPSSHPVPSPAADRGLVSVVLAGGSPDALDDQLRALANQAYAGRWELIIAGRRCEELAGRWRPRLPTVTTIDVRRGLAHACNVAVEASRGEVVMILAGEALPGTVWLERMVAAVDQHLIVVALVDGVGADGLPAEGTGIAMRRHVFDRLAGFDESVPGAEGLDFLCRATRLGIPIHTEPGALMFRRLEWEAWTELSRGLRLGMAEPWLHRRHPASGTVQAGGRGYRHVVRTIPAVIRGETTLAEWAQAVGRRAGRMIGSVRYRTLFL